MDLKSLERERREKAFEAGLLRIDEEEVQNEEVQEEEDEVDSPFVQPHQLDWYSDVPGKLL